MTNEIDLLEAEAMKARDRLDRARSKIRAAENAAYVGRYFRYSNCYSCPEKPSDRWWLYARVDSADGHYLKMTMFETDKYGKFSFEPKTTRHHVSDWEEISEAKFNKAYGAAITRVERAYMK